MDARRILKAQHSRLKDAGTNLTVIDASGGGGGCPSGGDMGGSSFGLVLLSSPGFTFTSLFLAPSGGGKGGDGGRVGVPGHGGSGGLGGGLLVAADGTTKTTYVTRGGTGGSGGYGARGGHGGGGSGGLSIAVWCDAPTDVSQMNRLPGAVGLPGLSMGNNSAMGQSLPEFGCN